MALSNQNFANYGTVNLDPEVVVEPSGSKEINSLCDNISTNIETINSYIRFFSTAREQLGCQMDTQGLRDQILVRVMSLKQLVTTSQKDMSRLNNLSRGASKQQKLQIQRLTGCFKDVMERSCQSQQNILEKLRTTLLPSSIMMESSEENASLIQAEQLQIQKNLEFEQGLLLERQERIKQIESQIIDANQLMRELSAAISDQGTMVDTIEWQIENVDQNIQMGHQELTTAAEYQAKVTKRKITLLCIVALVLVVLIAIVIWSATS